jgi:sec-independent protein translocase protein TatA
MESTPQEEKDSMAPAPLIAGLGPTEIILVILVILLLFGAKKLPELARGSGRALRIFKAETKGLLEDDEVNESQKTEAQKQLDAQRRTDAAQLIDESPVEQPRPRPDTER